jgi:hypothetical protein
VELSSNSRPQAARFRDCPPIVRSSCGWIGPGPEQIVGNFIHW